jgi:hypothetical protein
MQIAHQIGIVGFEWVVGRVVQRHAVGETLAPAVRADGVKQRRKLAGGFRKLLRLQG